MLKIFIPILLLITIRAHSQKTINTYLNLSSGYASDNYAYFSFGIAANLKGEGQTFYPIGEISGKFQLTNDSKPQLGVFSLGCEFSNEKMFLASSGGMGYVFNLQTIDRYKANDSLIITLSDGYAKSSYFSPYASFKAGIYINGSAPIPLFLDLSYVGKLVWYGVGIKITF